MDLLPTGAALAGKELPGDRTYDGADISDALLHNAQGREPLMFYWYQGQLRAVRRGNWKIHMVSNEPATGTRAPERHDPPMLFDLDDDESESHNVAASHPEFVRSLLALAEQHRQSVKEHSSPLALDLSLKRVISP